MTHIRKVHSVDFHRNGVSGAPFHIIRFAGTKGYPKNMIGIVFDEPYHVAVFDADLLVAGNVKFGENSWRGDDFEPELRAAIKKYEEK